MHIVVDSTVIGHLAWVYCQAIQESQEVFGAPYLEALTADGRMVPLCFCGIQFVMGDVPHTQYFHLNGRWERHYCINISSQCHQNYTELLYQVGHEAIHCIFCGGETARANVLEESMATWFSSRFISTRGLTRSPTDAKYEAASQLFEQLNAINPMGILHLRAIQPLLHLVTSENIRQVYPAISTAIADALSSDFDSWTP